MPEARTTSRTALHGPANLADAHPRATQGSQVFDHPSNTRFAQYAPADPDDRRPGWALAASCGRAPYPVMGARPSPNPPGVR